uniref:calcium-binding protein n=3 Tax=Pseudomonas syringae TaxID=317 RepID=UPI003204B6F2
MDSQTLKDISAVLYYFSSPVSTAPIINGAAQGDIFTPLLNTTQILVGFTDTLEGFAKLGKLAPLVGIGLSTISLSLNIGKIWDDMEAGVPPKLSDYYGALSDAAGIVSATALTVAGIGATAAISPVLLTAGVVAAVISATLTVASLAAGPKSTIDLQGALAAMQSSFAQIKAVAGDQWDLIIQKIHNPLNAGAELNDAIGSYLNDQSELIKNFLLDGSDQISSSLDEILNSLSESFEDALQTVSPLVLDLDGDGFKMTGLAGNTYFDHDANGVKEKSGWMDSRDGMLVRDLNHNGVVDSGLEVFGSNTLLGNGKRAINGFEALKDLDSNRDGVFDVQDAAYGELKIWTDVNGNAQSDTGELRTLSEAGIDRINLSYNSASILDDSGNRILQVGTYLSSGITMAIADEWFITDPTTNLLTGASASGPNLRGIGTVESLQQQISMGNYRLQNLLEDLHSASSKEASANIINEIIYEWTGANAHDSVSRGSYMDDGRKLFALEALMGKKFVQSAGTNEGTSSPGPNAAALLMITYSKLSEFIENSLALQTTYSKLLGASSFAVEGTSYKFNAGALISELEDKFSADPMGGAIYIEGFVKALKVAGSDFAGPLLTQLSGYQAPPGGTFGLALNNALAKTYVTSVTEHYGTSGSDILEGTSGADIIYGDKGDDVIVGGAGNDFLSGDRGKDTYKFSVGWGKDSVNVIADDGASDLIEFGIGVKPEDMFLSRVDDSLILSYISGDKITLINYFHLNIFDIASKITVIFSNGTVWADSYIRQVVATLSLDDTVQGGPNADIISSGAGNDTVNAFAGNDVLNGGTGDDLLNGGVGSDTYVLNIGDGRDVINETSVSTSSSTTDIDVISFLTDVSPSSVNVSTNGTDLVLSYNNGQDNITIKSWFASTYDRYQIERIEFADGTVWLASNLSAQFNQYNGSESDDSLDRSDLQIAQQVLGYGGNDLLITGAGNDVVIGGSGNDTLNTAGGKDQLTGGIGNDTLSGGTGSDTYFFNSGDDQDTIQETSLYSSSNDGAVDVLKFGTGISAADITVTASGSDVVFAHANGTDKITVKGWLSSALDRYQLERVEFADGTVWTSALISSQLLEFQGTEGHDVLNRSSIPLSQKLY